jgi:hypothetical protein
MAGLVVLGAVVFAAPARASEAGPRGAGSILAAAPCPSCDPIGVLDPDNFSRPTRIDNDWLPLQPGTQLVLQGTGVIDSTTEPHTVIFTVTDLTKRLSGIPCVVVWDRDIFEGQVRESELAFFAQDDDGNVWNLGEYPEEYDHGILLGAENTWIDGIENATAGVTVVENPRVGSPGYLEARAPENDFWDCGLAYFLSKPRGNGHGDDDDRRGKGRHGDDDRAKTTNQICVPLDCFRDYFEVHEWAPLEGCDVIQVKTYARNVGVVQIGAIGDPEAETLALVQLNHLRGDSLAAARKSALELDARGYTINEIYAQTEPAQLPPRRKHADRDDSQIATAPVPTRTFMRIGPNPVAVNASISYSVTKSGPVELSIFDVAGRRVRSLVKEEAAAGAYLVQWDARDDAGMSVAAGVYFARLRTPAQVLGKTVVVSR